MAGFLGRIFSMTSKEAAADEELKLLQSTRAFLGCKMAEVKILEISCGLFGSKGSWKVDIFIKTMKLNQKFPWWSTSRPELWMIGDF